MFGKKNTDVVTLDEIAEVENQNKIIDALEKGAVVVEKQTTHVKNQKNYHGDKALAKYTKLVIALAVGVTAGYAFAKNGVNLETLKELFEQIKPLII